MAKAPVKALKSAAGALKLKSIVLYSASFSRPVQLNAKVDVRELVKRAIEFARVAPEKAGSPSLLQVRVGLGVRIAGTAGEHAPVYLEIEADFIAEYEMTSAIDDAALEAFATFNSVHNVWPFWRQHVFDIVQRGHLLPIDVPLFSG
jgi:hypothetical protein